MRRVMVEVPMPEPGSSKGSATAAARWDIFNQPKRDKGDRNAGIRGIVDMMLIAVSLLVDETIDEGQCIGDTGLSAHMTFTLTGMVNIRDASHDGIITFANGTNLQTVKIWNLEKLCYH
jgi:hypothetical protein